MCASPKLSISKKSEDTYQPVRIYYLALAVSHIMREISNQTRFKQRVIIILFEVY